MRVTYFFLCRNPRGIVLIRAPTEIDIIVAHQDNRGLTRNARLSRELVPLDSVNGNLPANDVGRVAQDETSFTYIMVMMRRDGLKGVYRRGRVEVNFALD